GEPVFPVHQFDSRMGARDFGVVDADGVQHAASETDSGVADFKPGTLIDSLDDEQRGLTHDMLSPRLDCTLTRFATEGLRPRVLAGASSPYRTSRRRLPPRMSVIGLSAMIGPFQRTNRNVPLFSLAIDSRVIAPSSFSKAIVWMTTFVLLNFLIISRTSLGSSNSPSVSRKMTSGFISSACCRARFGFVVDSGSRWRIQALARCRLALLAICIPLAGFGKYNGKVRSLKKYT